MHNIILNDRPDFNEVQVFGSPDYANEQDITEKWKEWDGKECLSGIMRNSVIRLL